MPIRSLLARVTLVLALAAIIPARAQTTTSNLLTNPGAETGDLTGWVSGGDSNPNVDDGAFDPGIDPHTGSYDFYGHTGAMGSLTQTVTLVGNHGLTAAQIDTGNAEANITFWEQGLNQAPTSDDAQILVTFHSSSGSVLSTVMTPEIDSHNGTWQQYNNSYAIPSGTRSVDYAMLFIRHFGTDNDAFVDDNQLTVTVLASISSLSVSPISVTGGGSSTGTITLSGLAPSGGLAVTQTSSDTAVATLAPTLNIPAGAMSARFKITTYAVSATKTVTITSSVNGTSKTATLTVTPPVTLSSLVLTPTSVTAGTSSSGKVTLSSTAPAGGATVTLKSSNTSVATVPSSETISQGDKTYTFAITTKSVTSTQTVTITATIGSSTKTATLTVTPGSTSTLSSLTLTHTSVTAGNTSTGKVTLSSVAPAGGVTITIQSSNTSVATVPSSVSIAAGNKTQTFTINTKSVTSSQTVTITAAIGSSSKAAMLTVTP